MTRHARRTALRSASSGGSARDGGVEQVPVPVPWIAETVCTSPSRGRRTRPPAPRPPRVALVRDDTPASGCAGGVSHVMLDQRDPGLRVDDEQDHVASSIAVSAWAARPLHRTGLRSARPPVSTSANSAAPLPPCIETVAGRAGRSSTIATRSPTSRLKSVDLPNSGGDDGDDRAGHLARASARSFTSNSVSIGVEQPPRTDPVHAGEPRRLELCGVPM